MVFSGLVGCLVSVVVLVGFDVCLVLWFGWFLSVFAFMCLTVFWVVLGLVCGGCCVFRLVVDCYL